MKNWYLYYRIMHAVKCTGPTIIARNELQDVLVDLRGKAVAEWRVSLDSEDSPTDQQVQDFYEYLAGNPTVFTEAQARHLTQQEGW